LLYFTFHLVSRLSHLFQSFKGRNKVATVTKNRWRVPRWIGGAGGIFIDRLQADLRY